jgi:diacylglycerol O-acyltransferase
MQRLSPADQTFLWLEKRQQPMHVGGLLLFDFPEDAGSKYLTEMAAAMRQSDQPTAPFNRRLEKTSFGQYSWVEDENFDLDHHFRHVALPKPGRIRELLAMVSAEHSHLMDRQRPLWEVHLIEGVRGKRFAMYNKVHHAMMDGVAAMNMTAKVLSTDPNERGMPPLWATAPRPSKTHTSPSLVNAPRDMMSSLFQVSNSTRKQLSTLPTITKEITKNMMAAHRGDNDVVSFSAPASIFNQRITGSRRFAAQSYSLDRIKTLTQAFSCTLNDIVLAVCGSALRNYLISQNELPNEPLIALVPVSLREDDSAGGNQIGMILASLGTHIADPADRLRHIQKTADNAKSRLKHMSKEEIINYTALSMAPSGLQMLTGMAPKLRAFNVIISNVPGPKDPLYFNGAKMGGIYPVSIPVDDMALNITLVSYNNQLEFGLTACRRTLPSMQRLLGYLSNGIEELEIAANIK